MRKQTLSMGCYDGYRHAGEASLGPTQRADQATPSKKDARRGEGTAATGGAQPSRARKPGRGQQTRYGWSERRRRAMIACRSCLTVDTDKATRAAISRTESPSW